MKALLVALACVWAAAAAQANPLRNLKAGDKLPPFSLKDAAGKVRSLSDYEGRALVLCYFRSGQPLSDRALAALGGLQDRYGKLGADFLALRHADPGEPRPAKPPPVPVLEDPDRDAYSSWGLFIMPTTVVLDRQHRVAAAYGSYEDGFAESLARDLDAALGLPPRTAAPTRPARPAADAGEPPEAGLARRLLEGGGAQEALTALEPVLSSSETSCGPRLIAAAALLKLGRGGEAKAQAEQCLSREPASPRAALVMGRALAAAGDPAAAETWLRKAALGPDTQEARFRLGQLYERTGRKEQALDEYRAALERLLGP